MGNTAQPHWAKTHGSRCFVQTPHCNITVTEKDLMHCVRGLVPNNPGRESVSLVTNSMTATAVIPGSVLVLEAILITRTHVETWQWVDGEHIMGTKTSRLWATFLFNNVVVIALIWFQNNCSDISPRTISFPISLQLFQWQSCL